MPSGRGLGIAAWRSFVSYIATVIEVAVDAKGNLAVPRVDTAIDCGFVVNPERIRSQIEGAAVMGLTLAKYSEVTFKNGRAEQANFNDFPLVAHRQFPDCHPCPHGAGNDRRTVERRRRAGGAAVCAGAVQRDLRSDWQAHPAAADRRSVVNVMP